MPVVAAVTSSVWQQSANSAPVAEAAGEKPLAVLSNVVTEGVLPTILSKSDIDLYQTIFHAQKKADWETADAAIEQLHNHLLVGHVLAARYLDHRYNSTPAQLADWLNHYSDHPQAPDIYARAVSRTPSLKDEVPLVKKQATLEGYGDDNGLVSAHFDDAPYSHAWHAGLQAWKTGHKDAAAKLFASMSQYEMSPWVASASAYWAYRSYNASGDQENANKYLHEAAQYPRCFYGILARKELKESLDLDLKPVTLTDNDMLQMVGDQAIRRVIALNEAGFTELAEKELRLRFPQADENERPRLLALAHELGLASVQISMAKQLREPGHELDFARYPMPNWRPEGGFKVDPLLIYALVRQESGFRSSAVSQGGALGLMQLMPQTASLMQKNIGGSTLASIAGNVSEPVANVTLGQQYVAHLLGNELVEGNLFYLLAAYNAGPGRLQEWKERLSDNHDPLLFVESIPFAQTRNYVMQVMTNYWIYSELDGGANRSVHAVLNNNWPSYEQYQGTVAARDASASPDGA